MNTTIPALTIEENDDGTLTLEKDWCGEVDRIAIHPIHVRHLAERLGLIHAPGAEWNQVPPAGTLARRLRMLRVRCNHLAEYLALYSDTRHADLSYEQTYSEATADLGDEFCADLPATGDETSRNATERQGEPCHAEATPETGALNAPENGAIQPPPNRCRPLFE